MNLPKLRFQGFNEPWKKIRFGDIFFEKVMKTGDIDKYPLYSLTVEKGVTPKTDRYTRDFLVKKDSNYKLVESNDFVFNPMNMTIGALALYEGKETITVSGYYNVFSNTSAYNNTFLDTYLKTNRMINVYKSIATGSLIEKQRVHYSQFKDLKQLMPSVREANKISVFFSLVNRRIKKQQEKVELLKEQKKALMQKIFSRELRFKNEDGKEYAEWGSKCLKELGEFKKSYTFSRALEGNGDYHHLHYGDIHVKYEGILGSEVHFPNISVEGPLETLEDNDVIFADASEDYKDLGKAVVVCGITNKKVVAGLHTHRFSPNELIDSRFLMYFTKTKEYGKFIRKYGTGVSVLGLSKASLSNLKVPLPSLNEQVKIAEFLFKMDKKINYLNIKLKTLEEQKKGYMQQMFI